MKKLMNHATICVIKNQLRHPFSQYNKSMQDISTHTSIRFIIYINDSGDLKTKIKPKQKQIKDAPSLCDKVH